MMATSTCEWEVWSTRARLVVTEPSALAPARALAEDLLTAVDEAVSRFRPDSELMRLPAEATEVSPLCALLLQSALAAAELTEGRVDPTIGGALSAWGYDRDLRSLKETSSPAVRIQPVPGWRSIRLDDTTVTRPSGVQLDLGATAKAVTADLLAGLINDELGTGVLVSLGGDIATSGDAPAGGWQITVQDTDADPADAISLRSGMALATSSTTRRTWMRDGAEVHHIIDPATSQPAARVWRSVSIAAPTCWEANALSTASLVLGQAAPAWLARHHRAARLVSADGRVVRLGGWPEEQVA